MKYRFCPLCATPLKPEFRGGRERPVCHRCGYVRYENPVAGVAGIVLVPGDHAIRWHEPLIGGGAGLAPPGRTPLILLARRTIPPEGWCIPCGYVEADEEIRSALIREMEEETGLIIAPREVYAVQSNFHNPDQPTVGTWFLCSVTGGRAQAGDDVDRLALYPVTDPPPLAFPTDKVVLERLGSIPPEEL
ncbi:MAG: NUDIX domain-containing protein [Candidatus Eisenbacteria bacterium]|uniref:NUDIX domain-containing protein n=1 Tax=Eiseniibacteriota bacterium TaxID=2212470 RepID=A0A948W2K3_UNCEI|nr:NUDIX domain-containing protein [Candidatus Eisenbacteria bacterium]MBU1951023.1 NUDIX domain-containing protein [Candidatus Eisenbacteria bacterium]MBU2690052.1 NUDIX domain-containing protein [Candidatus Eisenbacteria bacterium]